MSGFDELLVELRMTADAVVHDCFRTRRDGLHSRFLTSDGENCRVT